MTRSGHVLLFVNLLAACVWVGGFVVVVVVVRVARRHLGRDEQIAFFRSVGRGIGMVCGSALLIALATGAVLLDEHGWDGPAAVAAALGAALLALTAAGVVQARGMGALRGRAAARPGSATLAEQVRRGARRAAILRVAIGAVTLLLLAWAVALA
jgi:uncharacterized membrane protein